MCYNSSVKVADGVKPIAIATDINLKQGGIGIKGTLVVLLVLFVLALATAGIAAVARVIAVRRAAAAWLAKVAEVTGVPVTELPKGAKPGWIEFQAK